MLRERSIACRYLTSSEHRGGDSEYKVYHTTVSSARATSEHEVTTPFTTMVAFMLIKTEYTSSSVDLRMVACPVKTSSFYSETSKAAIYANTKDADTVDYSYTSYSSPWTFTPATGKLVIRNFATNIGSFTGAYEVFVIGT